MIARQQTWHGHLARVGTIRTSNRPGMPISKSERDLQFLTHD
jgi:hypothetical protein